MKYVSEVTGKTYRDTESIWVKNPRQAARFIKNGATILDVVVARNTDDLAIVFDKEETEEMRMLWANYELR